MQNRAAPNNEMIENVINFCIRHRYLELTEEEKKSTPIIVNKLITTLLYKSKRHGWDGEVCRDIRGNICLLDPEFNNKEIADFEKHIAKQETENGTFYGSYLSSDSDSDEERTYQRKLPTEKSKILNQAKKFRTRAQLEKISYQKNTPQNKKGDLKANRTAASAIFKLEERHKIYHSDNVNPNTVQRDLNHLNLKLSRGASIENALAELEDEAKNRGDQFTQFYVAEYRGVTHLTTKWNKPSRKAHRQDPDELGKAQYSASIYKAAGISLFSDYETTKKKIETHPELFNDPAETLREILLTFREPKPYSYEYYSYSCFAYVLQNIYTQDFHGFHELIKTDEMLSKLLLNDANPFFSMGDTPYHALKYANGLKPYAGHEDERLRPRWRADGRAERPYSGVVYTSLHPLTDFNNDGPLHLISLNRDAEIKLKDELEIIAERESCFPGYLPANRVIHKHIAKYPSFKKEYKTINQYKYGLLRTEYEKFREGLLNNKPHTDTHKHFKKLLGEAICSYQEVRLIDQAREAAENKGGVLIYRDINGTFSLTPPIDSVNRNTKKITKEIKSPVKEAQKKRVDSSKDEPSICEFSDEESTQSFAHEANDSFNADPTDILIKGNHGMSIPLSLMLNAIKNKRYFALKHFLSIPMFQEAINEPFNSTNLEHGTLLHLAAAANDTKALNLLMNCPGCDLNAVADENVEDEDRAPLYEQITPAQYAVMQKCDDAARLLSKKDREKASEPMRKNGPGR